MKPKLLVVELWGLGDLLIATPFLQAAREKYEVTLLAKPYARDLQPRFWRGVQVVPFVAPWTAFTHKYQVLKWPWLEMYRLLRRLGAEHFDVGLSARRTAGGEGDPRDHMLLLLARARKRLGFPRWGGNVLVRPMPQPEPAAHRYENWHIMAGALGLELPAREALRLSRSRPDGREVLVHTGAGQAVRIWPLERYASLISRLRQVGYRVQVACDPNQQEWWLRAGEKQLATPHTVTALFELVDRASVFVGNDSGPGHLAAFCGVPTFTLFGPQVPEWFAPLHPASEWLEGKACPYKPCSDYCRFPLPYCMVNSGEEEVWGLVQAFVKRHLPPPST